MISLKDKVVIITGASSGFGEHAARLFSQEGCNVVLAARRLERLESLADEIRANGGDALPIVTDVTQHDQIQAMVRATLDRYGRIDILFNNAGFGRLDWDAIGWGKKPAASAPNKRRGKGLALMWKAPAMPPNAGSSAWVELAKDGTVTVGVGGQEIGQGVFTVAAQMAAAALGVPYESVRIASPVDTRYSPYEWQTVASRLTWSMGNAIVNAAHDAKRQILGTVSEAWDETPEDLDIVNGVVISYKTEKEIPLKNLAIYGLPKPNDQGWRGGPVIGRGNFMPTYVTGLNAETGQGERAVVHNTTGAQAVELEVDLDTGRIEILRGVSAFDVGKAINPAQVKAQMEGGFVQGMSSLPCLRA